MRTFVYDGRTFPDPDSKMSVDEVRQSLANFFPELSNAEAKETKQGEDTIIELKRRVGTKGATALNCLHFDGWVITCPHCAHKDYVSADDIAFDPMDDERHLIQCESCKDEFEIVSY